MKLRIILLYSFLIALIAKSLSVKRKTIFQVLSQRPEFSVFTSFIQNNSAIKEHLLFSSATVFVPTNNAFDKFNGLFGEEFLLYHVVPETKTIKLLKSTMFLETVHKKLPPLWIRYLDDNIYINQAKVIIDDSDHIFTTKFGNRQLTQVLHVIDTVLDPINYYNSSPTAFDFMKKYSQDDSMYNTKKFTQKVRALQQKYFFTNGFNTFFVPIDKGFNQYRLQTIDKYIIRGHIVPNLVLFTQPKMTSLFETWANDDYIYILVSFEEKDNKLFVKSNTVLGDANHKRGELLSEVILPNIPVENGVVHLISQPLAVFDEVLKPFPYLPVLYKLQSDPNLNITYHIGEITGFNKNLEIKNKSLTFFAPRDIAWKNISINLKNSDSYLGYHLIEADQVYTMELLLNITQNNYTTLNTTNGPIQIKIKLIDDHYNILWGSKVIRINRPDYICNNGIVHVIDGPLIEEEIHVGSHENEETPSGFWRFLKNAVS